MRSMWDPLSLAFSDAHLESHYTLYLNASTFLAVDRVFAYFGIVSNLGVALYELYLWRQPGFLVTSLVNGLCGATVAIALRQSNRNWFLKHRTQMILLLRSVRFVSGLCAYHMFPRDVSDNTLLMRIVVFGLFCTYWTCGMPLHFKIHAMHHSIALVLMFFYLQSAFCGHHVDLWKSTFKVLKLGHGIEFEPDEECRRVVLLILFSLGFALPTLIFWATELKSRLHFMDMNRIPCEGSIGKRYMATILIWALISIWILVAFNSV